MLIIQAPKALAVLIGMYWKTSFFNTCRSKPTDQIRVNKWLGCPEFDIFIFSQNVYRKNILQVKGVMRPSPVFLWIVLAVQHCKVQSKTAGTADRKGTFDQINHSNKILIVKGVPKKMLAENKMENRISTALKTVIYRAKNGPTKKTAENNLRNLQGLIFHRV